MSSPTVFCSYALQAFPDEAMPPAAASSSSWPVATALEATHPSTHGRCLWNTKKNRRSLQREGFMLEQPAKHKGEGLRPFLAWLQAQGVSFSAAEPLSGSEYRIPVEMAKTTAGDPRCAFHGTSLRNLVSICKNGLQCGFRATSNRPGVYCFKEGLRHKAWSYAPFCMLFADDIFYSVQLELQVDLAIQTYHTAGKDQWVMPNPEGVSVVAIRLLILDRDLILSQSQPVLLEEAWDCRQS